MKKSLYISVIFLLGNVFSQDITINNTNWFSYVDTIAGTSTPHEGRAPANLFDGSTASHWHSTSVNPTLPQSVIITFIDTVNVKSVKLINRTGEPSGTMPLGALKTGVLTMGSESENVTAEKPTLEGQEIVVSNLNWIGIELALTYTGSHGNSSDANQDLYAALGEMEIVIATPQDTTGNSGTNLKNLIWGNTSTQLSVYDVKGKRLTSFVTNKIEWDGYVEGVKQQKGLYFLQYTNQGIRTIQKYILK